jgi:hypothetical protein
MSTSTISPPSDTARIRALVAKARGRLRVQGALEGAATALIVATVAALVVVFAVRTEVIEPGLGQGLLAACGGIVLLGAILGASRRLDDELVARRVDRASGLADRLSTAIAFERTLVGASRGGARPASAADLGAVDVEDSREFMEAAIRDAVAATPRANVAAATPFRLPRDARAAAGFLAVSALVAGLAVPLPDRAPALTAAEPSFAIPGATITLKGRNLLAGVDAANAVASAGAAAAASVPANVSVFLGESGGLPVQILAWSKDEARVQIPKNAAYGDTALTAFIGTRKLGPVPFTVIDPKDQRYFSDDAVAMSEDDVAYAKALLEDLRSTAKADDVKELDEYVAKIEALLDQAERGEISKEKLLEELDKAQDELNKGQEPNQDEVNKDLAETGKELQKEKLTKELGKALAENDLQKAQEEMAKLAEKMEKGELTEAQEEQVAKAMEKAAEKFEQRQKDAEQKQTDEQKKTEEAIRKLEKEKQEAKTEQEKEKIGRQLEKKQDELKKLQREKEQKEQSAQRESLKRLHRNMKKTAESLQEKQKRDSKDESGKQEDRQKASRSMKDAAEETGKVDRDQRKTAAQKKVASQLEDLKEAMRRAKQKGAKGAKDPFGRDGKQRDFASRARGGKGSGQGWKPGAGQGQGKGQGKGEGEGEGNGGEGKGDKPSSSWGTGHDDNLTGDSTAKGGQTKDQDVTGVQGKGPSRRETILSAAQKGFASRGYQDVYGQYKKQVEEVMHGEKVPASYKYYVKRYFTKIKPHSMD